MNGANGTVILTVFIFVFSLAMPASAQQDDVVWVQIEAQPSLVAAQDRARSYATRLPDVSGFSLGNRPQSESSQIRKENRTDIVAVAAGLYRWVSHRW